MELIVFETQVIARTADGELLIALMDGARERAAAQASCVALLSCRETVGRSLCKALGSALKDAD